MLRRGAARYCVIALASLAFMSHVACRSAGTGDGSANVKDTEQRPLVDNITVGDVHGTVQATGIDIDKAQAYLTCRYADGAELAVKTPSQDLGTTLSAMGQPVGGGKLYSLQIKSGKLKPGIAAGLITLRSCAYSIHFEGVNTSTGERVLSLPDVDVVVGSRTNGTLKQITGPDLSQRVEAAMKPLQLRLSVSKHIEGAF